MAYPKDKIGIGIFVRNHLGIPQLAKIIPRIGHFKIGYGKVLGIIEGHVIGSSLGDPIIIERDLLLVVRSLTSHGDDFLELEFLSFVFHSNIDVSTFFSHVYRTSNNLAYLLAKATLVSAKYYFALKNLLIFSFIIAFAQTVASKNLLIFLKVK